MKLGGARRRRGDGRSDSGRLQRLEAVGDDVDAEAHRAARAEVLAHHHPRGFDPVAHLHPHLGVALGDRRLGRASPRRASCRRPWRAPPRRIRRTRCRRRASARRRCSPVPSARPSACRRSGRRGSPRAWPSVAAVVDLVVVGDDHPVDARGVVGRRVLEGDVTGDRLGVAQDRVAEPAAAAARARRRRCRGRV